MTFSSLQTAVIVCCEVTRSLGNKFWTCAGSGVSGCKAFCLDILHNVLFGEEGFPDFDICSTFHCGTGQSRPFNYEGCKGQRGLGHSPSCTLCFVKYAQTKVLPMFNLLAYPLSTPNTWPRSVTNSLRRLTSRHRHNRCHARYHSRFQ